MKMYVLLFSRKQAQSKLPSKQTACRSGILWASTLGSPSTCLGLQQKRGHQNLEEFFSLRLILYVLFKSTVTVRIPPGCFSLAGPSALSLCVVQGK